MRRRGEGRQHDASAREPRRPDPQRQTEEHGGIERQQGPGRRVPEAGEVAAREEVVPRRHQRTEQNEDHGIPPNRFPPSRRPAEPACGGHREDEQQYGEDPPADPGLRLEADQGPRESPSHPRPDERLRHDGERLDAADVLADRVGVAGAGRAHQKARRSSGKSVVIAARRATSSSGPRGAGAPDR